MKLVEPDYHVLLMLAHRHWIETRDPKDGDKFAALVASLAVHPQRPDAETKR
jgi:hypothetical protein